MILDWLSREFGVVLSWWLLATLAGAAVLPLCFRLLSALPDRGYIFARGVGLLLISALYWLLASLGFIKNQNGSAVLVWAVVWVVSLALAVRGPRWSLRDWWRANKGAILLAEGLFFVLLCAWALVRAQQNSLVGTEKPMELAFMSAIMRSDTFPPNDPWMAGYAISYYYLGYVQTALLAMLSQIPSTVAFNMTSALLFALTGLMSFGVGYNLVKSAQGSPESTAKPIAAGLLALFFVVWMGNWQTPIIEIPFQARALPQDYFEFWATQERSYLGDSYVQGDGRLFIDIDNWPSWWWFRASRVLQDIQLDGSLPPTWYAQPIDEFPQFSFLLADNHPHVLALPYAVMMIGLALNILLSRRDPTPAETALYGLCLGGIFFLNTWDGPIYFALLLGADGLRRLLASDAGRISGEAWLSIIRFAFSLLLLAIVPYLPFWLGFRSQAGGFVPNLLYPTQFPHYFIMFGPFLLLLPLLLMAELRQAQAAGRMNWRWGWGGALLITAGLVLVMALLTILGAFIPQWQGAISTFVEQNGGWATIGPKFLQRRFDYALTSLLLILALVVIIGRLFPRASADRASGRVTYTPSVGFALLLVALGVMLTLVPEFFYLRDNFSTRINTIFKFYYQAWVLFSIASAYAVYALMTAPNRAWRYVTIPLLAVVIILGSLYPILGIYHRTRVETQALAKLYLPPIDWVNPTIAVEDGQVVRIGEVLIGEGIAGGRTLTANEEGVVRIRDGQLYLQPAWTLDGGRSMVTADDYAVVMCLGDIVQGDSAVVAEAVRDAYNAWYGRVGALTGISIVLGWENHERQWRGATYDAIAGTRRADMDELYTDLRWDVAENIIRRYGIDYIVYGTTERLQYGGAGEEKFLEHLEVICESGDSRIYRVSQ